ncbi:hypothetical protein MKX08_003741 [Trichoderma sp. CBMAI-0020]|nr:hypothetical protein MKX08_003741 [Trichoderma sp. CBMAI-0020]
MIRYAYQHTSSSLTSLYLYPNQKSNITFRVFHRPAMDCIAWIVGSLVARLYAEKQLQLEQPPQVYEYNGDRIRVVVGRIGNCRVTLAHSEGKHISETATFMQQFVGNGTFQMFVLGGVDDSANFPQHTNLLLGDCIIDAPAMDEFAFFAAESILTPAARVNANRLLHAVDKYMREDRREILIRNRGINFVVNARLIYKHWDPEEWENLLCCGLDTEFKLPCIRIRGLNRHSPGVGPISLPCLEALTLTLPDLTPKISLDTIMASSSAEWPIGWIIPDLTEFFYTVPLLGPSCLQGIQLGHDDNLNWAIGDMYGKKVILIHAPKAWQAYAASAMKARFQVKIIFIGGTYHSATFSFPPIGHCLLKLPEIDERRYDRLSASIPEEELASLAKLTNGLDRFIGGAKEGLFNLDQVIYQWAQQDPQVMNGLEMPDATFVHVPATYPQWPKPMNTYMCCGQDFNSGVYTNQIPCLKVLAVSGYRGRDDNDMMWHKYATLGSAAAIACIIYNIVV